MELPGSSESQLAWPGAGVLAGIALTLLSKHRDYVQRMVDNALAAQAKQQRECEDRIAAYAEQHRQELAQQRATLERQIETERRSHEVEASGLRRQIDDLKNSQARELRRELRAARLGRKPEANGDDHSTKPP